MPARIRKGDRVMAISGKDKGKTGQVLEVRPRENRVVVDGINIQKRHTRPRPPDDPGGVIEVAGPIHMSNVALLDPVDQQPARMRIEVIAGKPTRVSVRSGEPFDS